MGNENGNKGNGNGKSRGHSKDPGFDNDAREEITQPDDQARLFCTNLGLTISEGGRRIASFGSKLAPIGSARRRASLLGLLEEVDTVTGTLDDARNVIRDYARNCYSDKGAADEPLTEEDMEIIE